MRTLHALGMHSTSAAGVGRARPPSYPHPHTFVCVEVHLNGGVPTGVQDLTGMDPLDCHGESVERREQDTFTSERLQDVVLTPSMSRLTERREFKEKGHYKFALKVFAPGNLEIHTDYRNL